MSERGGRRAVFAGETAFRHTLHAAAVGLLDLADCLLSLSLHIGTRPAIVTSGHSASSFYFDVVVMVKKRGGIVDFMEKAFSFSSWTWRVVLVLGEVLWMKRKCCLIVRRCIRHALLPIRA